LCFSLNSPVTSSLFGTNIFLITPFSNALSLFSSLTVKDQVSHPYKTNSRINEACCSTKDWCFQVREYNIRYAGLHNIKNYKISNIHPSSSTTRTNTEPPSICNQTHDFWSSLFTILLPTALLIKIMKCVWF
jgi:hypothetical protein